MRQHIKSFLHRFHRDQSGQVLVMSAVLLTGFLGMCAMVADVGDIYYANNQLQAATQAAALAGSEAISNPNLGTPVNPTNATPQDFADYYGSETGSTTGARNTFPILTSYGTNVSTTTYLSCNTFVSSLGISCITYNGSGSATANAIQVVQVAQIKTYFAGLFGHPYVTLTATASAARAGAPGTPHNIALIVDSTESMETVDTNCSYSSKYTRLQCALAGMQTLLENMAPCYSDTPTCNAASNGLTTPSVDRVALFTFPNITTTTMPYEYCDGGTVSASNKDLGVEPYTYPSTSGTNYTYLTYSVTSGKTTTNYNVTHLVSYGLGDADDNGYISDYKLADATQTLYDKSDTVLATGAYPSSCAGMYGQGGASTYYAGVIYAAAASLYAEQQANPGSQNVIVMLSDGEASATSTDMAASNNGYTLSTTSGTYPSSTKECTQAVTAAGVAAAAPYNVRIYAVAYGSESTTCSGDTLSPCSTMKGIASSPNYFYSDNNQSGSGEDAGCVGTAATTTNLEQIFTDIASDFTVGRLIPNSEFATP